MVNKYSSNGSYNNNASNARSGATVVVVDIGGAPYSAVVAGYVLDSAVCLGAM